MLRQPYSNLQQQVMVFFMEQDECQKIVRSLPLFLVFASFSLLVCAPISSFDVLRFCIMGSLSKTARRLSIYFSRGLCFQFAQPLHFSFQSRGFCLHFFLISRGLWMHLTRDHPRIGKSGGKEKITSASLGYPLSVFNQNSTLSTKESRGLRFFFFPSFYIIVFLSLPLSLFLWMWFVCNTGTRFSCFCQETKILCVFVSATRL